MYAYLSKRRHHPLRGAYSIANNVAFNYLTDKVADSVAYCITDSLAYGITDSVAYCITDSVAHHIKPRNNYLFCYSGWWEIFYKQR